MHKDLVVVDKTLSSVPKAHLRVARNTALLVALRIVMPALAVGLILMLSRYLGVTGLGRYTLAFSFLYMFNAIAPLGLGAIVTRDGARNRGSLDKLLGTALTIGVISSIGLSFTMAGLAYLLDYDDGTRVAIVILSFALVPCTIGMFQDSAFVALERMDCIAISTLAEYVVKVGVGMALLLMGYGLEAVLVVAIVGRTLACVISAFLLHRLKVQVRWTLEKDTIKHLLKLAPTFLFIGIFATLYWRIDIFMLSKLGTVEDVGYYGAAWRILELAMVLPQSLCLSLYPQISAAALKDLNQLRWIGRGAMRYLLALSIPAAIGVTLLAQPILFLLYGPGFGAAASTLSVLVLTLVPYSIVRYHAYVLIGANHQRVDLVLNLVMSAANIALNFLLIPRYGHFGAAVATFVSICAYGLLQYGYLIRKLPGGAAPITFPPLLLGACTLMAFGVWMLRDFNLYVAIVTGALVYGGCMVAGGFFSDSEIELLGLGRLRAVLRRSSQPRGGH
jgi:O-antigen/teichoic acid export membrane protein